MTRDEAATESAGNGAAREDGAVSPEALQLRQYLRWFATPNLAAVVGLVILYQFWSVAILPVLALAVGLNGISASVAYRRAGQNRVEEAVVWQSAGLWSLSILLASASFYALSIIAAILGVVIAVPYVPDRDVLRMALVATGVVSLASVIRVVGAPFPPDGIPDSVVQPILSIGMPVFAAACALSLWHTSRTLAKVHARIANVNQELQESERLLEQKVAERTAELAVARDAALEASRAKSRFLANVSHELRTPLNAILGYGEMLEEEAHDRRLDGLLPDVERILSSGRSLLTLVDSVLDLSKIESGGMDLRLERFDVKELVDDVIESVRPLADRNGNVLEIRGLEGAGSLRSDPAKLRQVLLNLLSNAAKFTRDGRVALEIERSSESGGDWLHLAVRDTGRGMTPEHLQRVFDAFARTDVAVTREHGGTGLGLAVSKRFCELLGGSLQATSRPGEGSRFVARLPCEAPQGEPSSGTEMDSKRSGPRPRD
jgi:signal transduction histidine kinase